MTKAAREGGLCLLLSACESYLLFFVCLWVFFSFFFNVYWYIIFNELLGVKAMICARFKVVEPDIVFIVFIVMNQKDQAFHFVIK